MRSPLNPLQAIQQSIALHRTHGKQYFRGAKWFSIEPDYPNEITFARLIQNKIKEGVPGTEKNWMGTESRVCWLERLERQNRRDNALWTIPVVMAIASVLVWLRLGRDLSPETLGVSVLLYGLFQSLSLWKSRRKAEFFRTAILLENEWESFRALEAHCHQQWSEHRVELLGTWAIAFCLTNGLMLLGLAVVGLCLMPFINWDNPHPLLIVVGVVAVSVVQVMRRAIATSFSKTLAVVVYHHLWNPQTC